MRLTTRASSKRHPVEPLHHEVRAAVVELTGLEDVDDVRVSDAVDDPRFEQDAIDAGPADQVLVQQLERCALADRFVRDRVDHAHSAATELALDDPRPRVRSRRERVGIARASRRRLARCRGANERLHDGTLPCSACAGAWTSAPAGSSGSRVSSARVWRARSRRDFVIGCRRWRRSIGSERERHAATRGVPCANVTSN
jgi:hypothetical protein